MALTNMAAARQANLNDAVNLLGPAALTAYNAAKAGSAAMQQDLTTIEQAIEWINDDELVEVAPAAIRVRKRILHHSQRKSAKKTVAE